MSASIYPPIGLLSIASSLEQDGHKVEIIDFYKEQISRKNLKNKLMSSDAVGISINTSERNNVSDISKLIKEIDPKIPQIIGGPHCTFFKSKSFIDFPYADICVISEGETVIKEIVQYLNGSKKPHDIHGIYYRENNQIKLSQPIKFIGDLDSLPFPARHLVEQYDYGIFPGGYTFKKKFTSMITSRGCPYNCRFCTRYSNIVNGYSFRKRSAENVVKEIQEINNKYSSVAILDDNFLADLKRTHKIFDLLIENGTNIEIIILGSRVDTANLKLYKKMKKANVKFVAYGIESGNQDVLDFYNKNITLQKIRKAILLGSNMGFYTFGSFILGAPIETKEHIKKTIEFACSLPLDLAVFTPLYYQMGSDIWNEGVMNKKISNDEYMVAADSRRGLGNFNIVELEEYTRKAYKRFYLRPNYFLNQIYKAFVHKNFNLLKNGWKLINSFF